MITQGAVSHKTYLQFLKASTWRPRLAILIQSTPASRGLLRETPRPGSRPSPTEEVSATTVLFYSQQVSYNNQQYFTLHPNNMLNSSFIFAQPSLSGRVTGARWSTELDMDTPELIELESPSKPRMIDDNLCLISHTFSLPLSPILW